jgi:diaminopimelate epimerase
MIMTRERKLQLSEYNYKIHTGSGTGNNFLIINAHDTIPSQEMKEFLICKIKIKSIDSGLIFQYIDNGLYKMHVIEKDGSESIFCGNGARVFAHFLYETKKIESAKLQIKDNEITLGKNEYGFFVECKKPEHLETLIIENLLFHKFKVCGEPHLITSDFFHNNTLKCIARKIQKTHSVNVSCIQHNRIITYERGVNCITKSCGSACIAATQFKIYSGFLGEIMSWICLGGINKINTKTFSLTGNTTLNL